MILVFSKKFLKVVKLGLAPLWFSFLRLLFSPPQILRLFSESTESIAVLKVDLAEAKKRLSSRNKQLHQLWYRSVTLRHIISLLDQIEGIAKVCPSH